MNTSVKSTELYRLHYLFHLLLIVHPLLIDVNVSLAVLLPLELCLC